MEIEHIILIVSNIAVPIIVAIISAKKHKKEIVLINAEHINRVDELKREHQHKLEVLELQYKRQQEFENQKAGISLVESLADKIADKIIEQPETQKMIKQKSKRSFQQKKRKAE